MEFEWDEAKRRANLVKHGVDFADMEEFDWKTAMFKPVAERGHGEGRFVAVSEFRGFVHTVIFTLRGNRVRLISVRRAKRKERRSYEKEKNRS